MTTKPPKTYTWIDKQVNFKPADPHKTKAITTTIKPDRLTIRPDRIITFPKHWTGLFRTIDIDCPWSYEEKGYNGMQEVQEYRIHCPYYEMTIAELAAMGPELRRISHPDGCHMYAWATKDMDEECHFLLREWGWTFKQTLPWVKTTEGLNKNHKGLEPFTKEELAIALRVMQTWGQNGKPRYGMGHWMRNVIEPLHFATNRESIKPFMATTEDAAMYFSDPDDERNYGGTPAEPIWGIKEPKGLQKGKRKGESRVHSRKPDEAYEKIRRNSPGPRVSIFCRDRRAGFVPWGNEVAK